MKALSLWQPWATLVAVGAKRIETRAWATNYRGRLAIHAARTRIHLRALDQCPHFRRLLSGGLGEFPLGAIVAVVTLVDIVPAGTVRLTDQERAFGDCSPGRYLWLLGEVVRLARPVSWPGARGLFDVPGRLLAAPSGKVRHGR